MMNIKAPKFMCSFLDAPLFISRNIFIVMQLNCCDDIFLLYHQVTKHHKKLLFIIV